MTRRPPLQIPVKRFSHAEGLPIPCRATDGSAGIDLHAAISVVLIPYTVAPGEIKLIPTGIALAIPKGYVGLLAPRSGVATKYNVSLANSPGVIDEDFRGEVLLSLHNRSDKPFLVNRGDRLAQLLVMPYLPVELVEVEELVETERGSGGFGSTGRIA